MYIADHGEQHELLIVRGVKDSVDMSDGHPRTRCVSDRGKKRIK